MKITSGEYKHRKLIIPYGYETRPTSAKVREAVFSMIGENVYDAMVLDLFAGSGSMGLEALSRGAKRCLFCDNSQKSIDAIKENIDKCKANMWSDIYKGDFKKNLDRINESFDIIFLDPPYKLGYYEECINIITEKGLLNEDGIIIIEHDIRDVFEYEKYNLNKIKEKNYGKIGISIFKFVNIALEKNI
ncbi:MAG TPA: 16S rRNA (guanine(966)-N(2))-methyltransferase RsmD [Anaerovoracaceae bacterium]|nr:16S rRNA (guanine(966)-N(2))-methyltransferase RsmD [Anaerovoracaceae bacterium]